MKRLFIHHTYTNWAVAALVVAVGLLLFLSFSHRVYAESSVPSANEHIITVHDDGVDKGFITTAGTLREALEKEKIAIDPKDRTEPGLDETLVAASYEVNIYRARPVLVRDQSTEVKVISSYRTGKQIAKEAGITLYGEDKAVLGMTTDLTATSGAAEVLTISRATPVEVVFYGKSLIVRTFAKTVGEMLAQKGITPAANDTLMPAASTVISNAIKVELWKNGEQTVTLDEDIAYDTQQIKDANQDRSYKQVQTPGVNGKKTVTYKITMQNGKEVKREAVNSVTTKEPVKQVEVVGTKVNLPPGSHSDWMRAAGIAESDFGIAEWLIQKESGWNPNALNASSGACGLVQALPCSKLGPNWNDPIVALRWGDAYVKGRYGGWAGAYDFWVSHRWY
ncbi:MAG: G5 domain-containing protein [Candidatus Saccharimonas sp.]|nr:G5 domain-containing protein [Candidatus Saccharimonas sp.]